MQEIISNYVNGNLKDFADGIMDYGIGNFIEDYKTTFEWQGEQTMNAGLLKMLTSFFKGVHEADMAEVFLKKNGMYAGNLWSTSDVTNKHGGEDATDEEAMGILEAVLEAESTMEFINTAIQAEVNSRVEGKFFP